MRNPATASDVSRLLGDVDPLFVERIVETGASPDEIDEALRADQDDEPHEPSSARVVEVRAVLAELRAVDEYDDEEDLRV